LKRSEKLVSGAAEGLATKLASGMTRRSFLGRLGGAVLAATGGAAVAAAVKPEEAEAFHLCGHIWTTGSCPSPYTLPRIDKKGFPLRPSNGFPIAESGARLAGPDGQLLERGPRTRLCEEWVHERFRLTVRTQGSWYRCCNGQVRKIVDCCSPSRKRINGDASLVGYCWGGNRVFCIMYYDSGLPC
jgi:hypothetical protein